MKPQNVLLKQINDRDYASKAREDGYKEYYQIRSGI